MQQLLVFALHQAADGNAGPVGDDLSHRVGVHTVRDHRLIGRVGRAGISRFSIRALRGGKLLLNGRNLAVQNLRGLRQVAFTGILIRLHAQVVELGLLELHFLHFKTGHLALQLIDLLRRGVELHTQVSGRLIDQVDGLVRQLTA